MDRPFHYNALQSGRYSLDFHGYLPLGWVGSLTQGLYDRKISIISGSARRANMSQWNRGIHCGASPFVGFCRNELERLIRNKSTGFVRTPDLSINAYNVKPCFKANGSIYVEIEGHDRIRIPCGNHEKILIVRIYLGLLRID